MEGNVKLSLPWRRSLLEGFVIVASILLAFGIDAWWDRAQERALGRELLFDLQADFAATAELLEVSLTRTERALAATQGFAAWSFGGLDLSRDSVAALTRGLFAGTGFTPATAHYQASVASGEIRLIDSDSLLVFLNRFDYGLQAYEQHRILAGEMFYWGPINDLRREFGGQSGFLDSPDLMAAARNPSVRAAAESVVVVQANIRGSMAQMAEANVEILRELDRLIRQR